MISFMTHLGLLSDRRCTGRLSFRWSTIGDSRSETLRTSGPWTILRTGLESRLNLIFGILTPSWNHGLQLLSRRRRKQCTVTCMKIIKKVLPLNFNLSCKSFRSSLLRSNYTADLYTATHIQLLYDVINVNTEESIYSLNIHIQFFLDWGGGESRCSCVLEPRTHTSSTIEMMTDQEILSRTSEKNPIIVLRQKPKSK